MAIYRPSKRLNLAEILPSDRLSNQVVLNGVNQTLSVAKGIFFLEYLQADGVGTVTIQDGEGTTITSGVSLFNNDYIPLRCDLGVTIVGDVAIAKGFVIEGIFA